MEGHQRSLTPDLARRLGSPRDVKQANQCFLSETADHSLCCRHVTTPTDVMELGLQLTLSAALVLVMTVVHTLGLLAISRVLPLEGDRLDQRSFDLKSAWLFGRLGLLLFILHILEIGMFAGLYLALGAMKSVEEALYYSASAYATLGRTADYFPDEFRLIGAVEALIGFILISWSTAFLATILNKLRQ